MGSYDEGKYEVCSWIQIHFRRNSKILDMGACDGKWRYLLPRYRLMDGVELYEPNYKKLKDLKLYRNIWLADARTFKYEWYDLIIFGDIIEHMTPEEAKEMLEYAKPRCRDMIIAVPFLYHQGAEYGNPYEVHVQDDLTAEIFEERFPGYSILCSPRNDYCYYHKQC